MKPETAHLSFIAIQATLSAAEELKKGFTSTLQVDSKPGRHNLVTQYDLLSEEILLRWISKEFPDHNVLAEESGEHRKTSNITWIIDPLDGTVNFAHGIPHFCISVAACIENEIVSAVVYQPLTHEMFFAEKGKGAFLNGKPLRVSSVSTLDEAIVATGFPYNVDENPLNCIDQVYKALKAGIPVRRLGSAALDLCYTAAGKFDAYWEAILQPWDLAAGKLIVEEAQGKVTDYSGNPIDIFKKGSVLATNRALHNPMLNFLQVHPHD
ncbi:MAG: inositol monophosphatase [Chlamydiae bacterium]|nr:inositol monophosphatase [Chlamydiota bacterium]